MAFLKNAHENNRGLILPLPNLIYKCPMTSIAKESGRLAWMKAALGEQREIVATLLRRLTCYAAPGNSETSVFPKFLKTLQQISIEKDIESEIISRIQVIESRHRFQRRCKTLRSVSVKPGPRKYRNSKVVYEPEQKRPNDSWLLIVGLVCLMSGRSPKPEE